MPFGEDNRNYFVGIANLNVPGLTPWHNENGLTNAIKITYVSCTWVTD